MAASSILVGSIVFDQKLKRHAVVYQLKNDCVHLAFEGWLIKQVPLKKFNKCRYTIFYAK